MGSRFHRMNRKKRRIDYNAEIPFEKQPAIGFYDTSEDTPEDDRHNFKRLRREDVDGVRRDGEEAVSEPSPHLIIHIYVKDRLPTRRTVLKPSGPL